MVHLHFRRFHCKRLSKSVPPVVKRYQDENLVRYFRGDAAFANPNIYQRTTTGLPEARGFLCGDGFAEQGVNLSNVTSITLGLSSVTGGTGMLYFDDIRLYAP